MKIKSRFQVEVGSFGVNCTILAFGEKAWIVDPGQEADRIAAELERHKLVPEAILLTHAHFDHIGAVPELQARYPGLHVYLGAADQPLLTHPLNQMPPDYPPIAAPANLIAAEELSGVTVISTPGHTPGGVCYWFPEEKLLLAGDTLFAGSVGRTDLPGGDWATLMASLEKLKALPEETMVIPGHGMTTTIGRELSANPYLNS